MIIVTVLMPNGEEGQIPAHTATTFETTRGGARVAASSLVSQEDADADPTKKADAIKYPAWCPANITLFKVMRVQNEGV